MSAVHPDSGTTPTRPANAHDPVCEVCGGRTIERHCKIQCLNCGYTRDCSDP
ncbi:MAG: hypothetical protein O2909_03485 [Chloroflexi bacterium]|nr:hypothetical protein [Chloroflexota bacterium]MDA1218485.1 hypothetical protein [Chloroflexota bacterium]